MPRKNNIQIRKGTSSDWNSANPVLASGEPGFDLNNNVLKIGDGSTSWINLDPIGSISGSFDIIAFNNTGDPDLSVRQLAWNNSEGTLALALSDTYEMFLGGELHYRVRNNTGSTILAGTAVYATGLTPGGNNRIEVAPKVADGSIREVRFMGLMTEDCNTGVNGFTTHFGYIRHIDTRGDASANGTTNKLWASGEPSWSEGDILYVHPTVAGKLTKIEPKHSISVAIILNRHANQGKLFVRPTSYGHLNDNHDVSVSGATNGQFLQYNSSTDYWVPSSSGNFTNLTINDNPIVTGVGTSGYLPKFNSSQGVANSLVYDNGTNVGIGIVAPSALFSVHGGITSNYTAVALSTEGVSTTTHVGVGNSDSRPFLASLNGNLSTSIYGWGFFDRGTDGNLHLQRKGGSSSWSSVMMVDRTNGNIGIGTGVQATTPPEKLTVDGNIRVTDAVGTQGKVIQFSRGGGTEYDYTIGRYANALAISLASDPNTQRPFQVGYHSGVTFLPKFHINGYTGDVGMGTVTPSGKLDVAGDVYVRGTGNNLGTIYFKSQAVGDKTLYVGASNGGDLVLNGGGANLQLSSQGGYANLFASSTQLHIGHGYDAGNAFQTIRFFPAAKEMMRMTTSGTLGIGLPTSASSYAGNPVQLFNQQPYANTRVHIAGSGSDSGSAALIVTNSGISPLLYVRNDGNIGIGTTTPTYKLEVNGSFAASTKSFRIHHPSKKDHSLEYGSLESPYHGVRLTGRGKVIKGVGAVSLPVYLKDLIHDDDTLNIQITNIKHSKTIYIDKIDLKNDRFIVKADRAKSLGELQFCWTLSGVRKDVDHLVVEKRN